MPRRQRGHDRDACRFRRHGSVCGATGFIGDHWSCPADMTDVPEDDSGLADQWSTVDLTKRIGEDTGAQHFRVACVGCPSRRSSRQQRRSTCDPARHEPKHLTTPVLDTGVYRAAVAVRLPDPRPPFTGIDGSTAVWADGTRETADPIVAAAVTRSGAGSEFASRMSEPPSPTSPHCKPRRAGTAQVGNRSPGCGRALTGNGREPSGVEGA